MRSSSSAKSSAQYATDSASEAVSMPAAFQASSVHSTMKVEEVGGAAVPMSLVEVRGTYDGGMSGAGPMPGAMLLGGIAEGPDAPWFFKLVGPEDTIESHRDAFVAMLESVRTGE